MYDTGGSFFCYILSGSLKFIPYFKSLVAASLASHIYQFGGLKDAPRNRFFAAISCDLSALGFTLV